MIRILATGALKANWARDACDDYLRRTRRFGRVAVEEIADSEPEREGREMLAVIGHNEALIACDPAGDSLSSEELAALLGRHGSISFALGGPDGLSSAVRESCVQKIAFGRITLPHELARVVLLEQIYRALSIRAGHPYHR